MAFLKASLPYILILFFACAAIAQPDLYFESLGFEDGLEDTRVNKILQDRKGFMWFATERSGFYRYDGREMKSFKYDLDHPEQKYPGKFILGFFEDKEGYLWLTGIDSSDFALFKFDPEKEAVIERYDLKNYILNAHLGKNGRIWIGHMTEGLLYLDEEKGEIRSFVDVFAPEIRKDNVWDILEDSYGNLWFTYPNGIYQWVIAEKHLIYHPFRENYERGFEDRLITALFEDSRKVLWIGTNKGLFVFDRDQSRFKKLTINDENLNVFALGEDDEGFLWISHLNGLTLYHPKKGIKKQYPLTSKKGGLVNSPRTIYRDHQGNMWLGHSSNGITYWNRHQKKFSFYHSEANESDHTAGFNVSGLHELNNGQIWVATNSLKLFDPNQETFSLVGVKSYQNPYLLSEGQNDRVLLSSWREGLRVLGSGGQLVAQFKADPTKSGSLPGNAARLAFHDREGNIWVVVHAEGLYRFQPEQNKFLRHPIIDPETRTEFGTWYQTIHQDQNGNLWLGKDFHLIKLTKNFSVEKVYNISTYQLHEDSAGLFWIASRNGLYRLDPLTGEQKAWRQKDGLPTNGLNSILADEQGSLWLGTDLGLVHFDPKTEGFTTFNVFEGISGYKFNIGASLKTQNGEFYFGLNNGMLRFHPDSIRLNPMIPPVVITDFKIHHSSVPIRGSLNDTIGYASPLEKHIAYTERIELNWRQNDISFEFASLNYLNPEKNEYKYRLDNYDEEWTHTSADNPTAVYTNLDPGQYRFRVIGSNNDGIWNETGVSLSILISPPWWATWWAYSLYGLLAIIVLYGLRTYELNRKLAHYEAERYREINQAKSRLYSNITHEFRTPLSIILGVSRQAKKQVEAEAISHLNMIERNGRQLLQLVNQLLDLSKVDSGKFQLNYQQGDIINYLKYLIESFHSLAEQKAVHLHFLSDLDSLMMDYDQERLQQVFYNLLSNALKFTSEGGHIYLQVNRLSDQELELMLKDTGIGIPEDQLTKIFDRFYQLDDSHTRRAEGTGIGLALVKELIRLMGGRIAVKSKPGRGTAFIITLPIRRTAAVNTKIKLEDSPINGQANATLPIIQTLAEGPKILVIEDNQDVQFYIQNCLSTSYQVETAFDGEEGIQKAKKKIPDLIICDVMMPLKDGFEVCETLKKDLKTSHVPIVMLTAKADFESKLQGLRHGADVYLSKPFQEEELLLHIHNLLLQRERLQQHYLFYFGLNEQPEGEQAHENVETNFVENVKAKILDHLSDGTFTVSQLSREMALSPSQLHRKLTALTGYSAGKMIRMIRLNHAKKLLQNHALTIAAVAYDSGFNDPDYLSKVFKQEFGITPTEFRTEKKAK